MKKGISVICTTFNEELTIHALLEALVAQTVQPAEIIVCDGQSQDATYSVVQNYSKEHPDANITLISKKGNRSIGRNAAIEVSRSDLIAITDAGCIPEKDWLEKLWQTHKSTHAPVVAGYYKGLPKNSFEKAVVPYVLVMPDRLDANNFLPATRSMLLDKRVWNEVGRFDEKLSLNEDYAFAHTIKEKGYPIAFAMSAVVGWLPRTNITQFYVMIQRFAQGDIQAGLIRPKVVLIFVRYILVLLLLLLMLRYSTWLYAALVGLVLFLVYGGWAVYKNIRYVRNGWFWLPLLQFTSDIAVMHGSLQAMLRIK